MGRFFAGRFILTKARHKVYSRKVSSKLLLNIMAKLVIVLFGEIEVEFI